MKIYNLIATLLQLSYIFAAVLFEKKLKLV